MSFRGSGHLKCLCDDDYRIGQCVDDDGSAVRRNMADNKVSDFGAGTFAVDINQQKHFPCEAEYTYIGYCQNTPRSTLHEDVVVAREI